MAYDLLMRNSLIVGEKYSINELKVNSIAELVELKTNKGSLRSRFLDLGLTVGARIQIKKIAPLGDPVSFEIRGYELGLRREELKNIIVRLIR